MTPFFSFLVIMAIKEGKTHSRQPSRYRSLSTSLHSNAPKTQLSDYKEEMSIVIEFKENYLNLKS